MNILATLLLLVTAIHVSPDGNDMAAGQPDSPKATVQAALRQVRESRRLDGRRLMDGSIVRLPEDTLRIVLHDGIYFLDEPILLRPEDSGTPECPTLICAAPGARPILSGGCRVEHWAPLSAKVPGLRAPYRQIWTARVESPDGQFLDFRQLYVNGKKALKACDVEDPDRLNKILATDPEARQLTVPAPATTFRQVDGLEVFLHQMWEVAVLRVKSITVKQGKATLSFHQPEGRLEFEHPWPPAVISENGNSPYRLSGAIELLDTPGEWYYDRDERRLYYWPREGEDMTTAHVIVPRLESLVVGQGSVDRPLHHIGFRGISFQHSTWMRPSLMGYVPLQAGMFLLDAYKLPTAGTPDKAALENQAWVGRQPAAVVLSGVDNTFFEQCRFEHLGASGLDYLMASRHDRVEGCVFDDIAGSGLVAGKFSDPGIETHLPYRPLDLREVSQDMTIRNNYVHDCANEYWGCVGILAGYVRDFDISHNEVCELPYSGISVGWGWIRSDNCMKDNHIVANEVHHFGRHNYSCGGLYTLSAQTGTLIAENYVHDIYHPDYVHDTTQGHYIYLDEASSWMTIRDNWCTETRFGQNQPGLNHWENNGPQVSDTIRLSAGLQSQWRFIKESR